ncbi:unnamed protein product, partial [Mesorhabditis spiculigera]
MSAYGRPALLRLVSISRSVQEVVVRQNAHRASLGKIGRSQYLLKYPVRLIRPDGSTIQVRADEPRETVQLAIDLKTLTDDERRQRLAARKPKAKKIRKEVIDDNFDSNEYMKYWAQPEPETATKLAAADKAAPKQALADKAPEKRKDNKKKNRWPQSTAYCCQLTTKKRTFRFAYI